MKVGVISDTHLATGGIRRLASKMIQKVSEDLEALYELLAPYFKDVSAVIHAGDLVDLAVLEVLKRFGEVYAVAGNMDPASVRQVLPEKRIIELKIIHKIIG